MNGVEGDDRIEIELTPSAPRHPPSPPPEPEGEASASDLAARLRDGAARGRVAALVVGVGLGALFLGWILGRSGSEDAAADAPATSDVAADERSDDREGEDESAVLPTIRTVPPTTTERPRRTTTTLPPAETTVIEVAPQLAGLPYELVGIRTASPSATLVTLDLASGGMVERRVSGLNMSQGPPMILAAGRGWVILPDWNRNTSMLIEDGAEPVETDLGRPWLLLQASTPGEFWRLGEEAMMGLSGEAQLVDRYGQPVGESIPLDRSPIYADPAGGVIVTTTGGTYSVTPEGSTRIVDGDVLAIGTDRMLARRCDEQLTCQHVVVDRATGEMRPIETDKEIARADGYYYGAGDVRTVGPDGHTAGVTWNTPAGPPQLGLVDLDTGEVTDLSDSGEPVLRWSPDGRFAFYLVAGLPMAYDLTSGESFAIADDLPRLSTIDVRPSSGERPAG